MAQKWDWGFRWFAAYVPIDNLVVGYGSVTHVGVSRTSNVGAEYGQLCILDKCDRFIGIGFEFECCGHVIRHHYFIGRRF